MTSSPVPGPGDVRAARRIHAQLAIMLFFQFAILATWRIVLSRHMEGLGFDGTRMGLVFASSAVGAIVSPLAAGWMADRFVSAQAFAGYSHLVGAVLLAIAWRQTEFPPLWAAMFAYTVVTMPTLALTTTIALRHLNDPSRFGGVRVWGTVGWVAISAVISGYLWLCERMIPGVSRIGDSLAVGAMLSVAMGVFCLTLPDTPPLRRGGNPYAFLLAVRRLGNRRLVVLLATAFVVSAQSPFFYNLSLLFVTDPVRGVGLPESGGNLLLTVGQASEIVVMLVLGASIRRWGIRATILAGIGAWAARYALFAFARSTAPIAAAQLLHGVCYAFFSVGAMIAIDRLSPPDLRASAQGLFIFATMGVGMLVGNLTSGVVFDLFATADGGHAWTAIFLVPIGAIAVAGTAFALLFREPEAPPAPVPAPR